MPDVLSGACPRNEFAHGFGNLPSGCLALISSGTLSLACHAEATIGDALSNWSIDRCVHYLP